MPQFKHLLDDKCPFCKSDVARASISGFHCNGGQFEKVEYDCGHSVSYEPNFSKKVTKSICKKSAAYKEMEANREIERKKLEKYIRKLSVSDELKKTLLDEIGFPFRHYF